MSSWATQRDSGVIVVVAVGRFLPSSPRDDVRERYNTLYQCSCCVSVSYVTFICSYTRSYLVLSERELTLSLYVVVRPSVACLSVCNVRAPYSGN